jgi:release factor glutamine methyltransferase
VEFWSLELEVSVDVLCPRPETEHVVEEALRSLRSRDPVSGAPVAVDVGTGSGCIAVALATEIAELTVHAVDVSGAALATAGRNAQRHGVGGRVRLHRGDLLEPLAGTLAPGSVDVVASNPPYVRRSEAGELDPEVLWDPAVAVFCEGDPAELYRRLAAQAAPLLRPGGSLVLELAGAGSEPVVEAVRAQQEWAGVRVLPDLQGLPRVLVAVRR